MTLRRKPVITRPERDLLIRMIDCELDDSLVAMREYGDVDRRRIMRDYVEELDALRNKLVRLK